MFQTVILRTRNLSKECKNHYNINDSTISAQLFFDSELYGIAIRGYSIMHNSKHFDEFKKESDNAKKRADKAIQAEKAKQKALLDQQSREEKINIIKGFGLDSKMEQEFIGVFVDVNV